MTDERTFTAAHRVFVGVRPKVPVETVQHGDYDSSDNSALKDFRGNSKVPLQ